MCGHRTIRSTSEPSDGSSGITWASSWLRVFSTCAEFSFIAHFLRFWSQRSRRSSSFANLLRGRRSAISGRSIPHQDHLMAADVCIKTLDDWRRCDAQFAADWYATIERVMKRLREQPLDNKREFKRSRLQYCLKATPENKKIVLAMLADGATYAAAAAAIGAHHRTIIKWPDRDEE